MHSLRHIHRYQELLSRQQAGKRLSIEDALTLEALRATFAAKPPRLPMGVGHAILSIGGKEHHLKVEELASEGLVCSGLPTQLARGSYQLRIEDPCENLSYIFQVKVQWLEEPTGHPKSRAGFQFLGSAIVLRWSRGRNVVPASVLALEDKLLSA